MRERLWSLATIFVATLCLQFGPIGSGSAEANPPPHPSQATRGAPPILVNIFPEETLIPPRHKPNQRVQIILTGNFRNTCFRQGPTDTNVNLSHKSISIEQKAYYYTDQFCLQVLVPYTQTLDLGVLPVGQYDVMISDSRGLLFKTGTVIVSRDT